MRSSLRSSATSVHRRRWKQSAMFWTFVGPLVLGLLCFTYVPILSGLVISFFQAQYSYTPSTFVGWANYVALLHDSDFLSSLQTIMLFVMIVVPLTFAFSLLLALLIHHAGRWSGLFRTIFLLPSAVSIVVAAFVWRDSLFLGLPSGMANTVISTFHADPISWVVSYHPPWYWLVIVTCRFWLYNGLSVILFLAGLQEIPQELYEAAHVDGLSRGWPTLRRITLPLLRNVSSIVLAINIIAAFQAFDEFYNLFASPFSTSGSTFPVKSPLLYLFEVAFSSQDYGKGSAGSFVLTLLILAFTLIQTRLYGFGRSAER